MVTEEIILINNTQFKVKILDGELTAYELLHNSQYKSENNEWKNVETYNEPIESVNMCDASSVKKIEFCLFNDNFYLTEIVFPPHLEEIGAHSFHFTSLKNIKLPDTIKKIDCFAFADIKKLVVETPRPTSEISEDFAFDGTDYCEIPSHKNEKEFQ